MENDIVVPETDEDYEKQRVNAMYIDVRRNYFLADAMRECSKKKFDPKKVIKVGNG